MTRIRTIGLAVAVSVAALCPASAQESPSYAKHVRPFLVKYCVECHNAKNDKRGLIVESYKSLMEGSDLGPVIDAGKPDESKLILTLEKKEKPHMPPKEAKRFPTKAEIAQVRAWVAAGAKDDSGLIKVAIPEIKPHRPTAPAISCLAYHPQGHELIVGHLSGATLIDVASMSPRRLDGPASVYALAYSRDGRRFALAHGAAASASELVVAEQAKDRDASAKVHHAGFARHAHADVILDLVFSPNGNALATCSYDNLVKLWDTSSGRLVHVQELKTNRILREHSDTVYGVTFSPDGTLLASGGADRAVKLWDVATGKLLYTLGESTDWVYTVAFSPDGKHLAAAGVDKSIRVWEVGAEAHKLVHSVFAHEEPVLKLVYAKDGKTLYSLGEDRIVKAWDAARMVERKVYDRQPETVLALALSPDQKQLALGRYDGVVVLLDTTTGKVEREIGNAAPAQKKDAEPKPAAPPKKAALSAKKITPAAGTRGRSLVVSVEGDGLDGVAEATFGQLNLPAKILEKSATRLKLEFTVPPTTTAGAYALSLKAADASAAVSFTVDAFPAVTEKEGNNSPGTGQLISMRTTVVGMLDRAGDVDFYSFTARAIEELGVHILTKEIGSKLEPVLQLLDDQGRVLAEGDSVLGHRFDKTGTYALGVRDRELRGGKDMHYRLQFGDLPVVTSVFPLGLRRGTQADITLDGVYLASPTVKVKAPADAALDSRIPVPATSALGTPLGGKSVVIGEFPEVITLHRPELPASVSAGTIPVPGTGNGELHTTGKSDVWSFHAKKGQRLIVETNARRLGSELDSVIEILDAKGQPVPRATLRSLAKTYVTFRDHDSRGGGIRIEAWGELAVNDYIYVGSELLRIRELPTHPDADCNFFTDRGQRIGFLDTTPTHLSNNLPMYKVAIHPPGTAFPPNGFPVVTLYYRNDDGGPGYGRDSRLFFDPPADGEYQVRITDARGQGGENYGYRLTIRPPRPSFNISFNPTGPAVYKGGAIPVSATAERIDGYDGEIALALENLPSGFHAPATSVPAGENTTTFALYANADAKLPAKAASLKMRAHALIDGTKLVKEVAGGAATLIEPGDIITTTQQSEVTLKPGGTVKLTVNIERRNKFGGRVPVEVRGLPHGVKVLDIGLNGILITETETRRTFVLYAEPWVAPTEHPFVVLAKREGKNSEHAAKSVLLKVAR